MKAAHNNVNVGATLT